MEFLWRLLSRCPRGSSATWGNERLKRVGLKGIGVQSRVPVIEILESSNDIHKELSLQGSLVKGVGARVVATIRR